MNGNLNVETHSLYEKCRTAPAMLSKGRPWVPACSGKIYMTNSPSLVARPLDASLMNGYCRIRNGVHRTCSFNLGCSAADVGKCVILRRHGISFAFQCHLCLPLTIIKVGSLAVLHVASSRGLFSTWLLHQRREFKRVLLDICAKDVSTHERMMWKSGLSYRLHKRAV